MANLSAQKEEFERLLSEAHDPAALEQVRVRFLGRKGVLAEQFKEMSGLSSDDRRSFGAALNDLKIYCEIKLKEATSRSGAPAPIADRLDVTLPGRRSHPGAAHPIITTLEDICEIFRLAGFDIAAGPEIETDWYNFEALNVPPDHPARDMHDTFYISDLGFGISDLKNAGKHENPKFEIPNPKFLLRTHTSPVQIHVMERQHPPVRVIAPGRVYRRDDDVSHAPMFHQVEGLWVDEGVTLRDLKGLLEYFAKSIFGEGAKVRFRPSFFPFTEPSLEVDVSCVICGGKSGCRTCKSTGWLEILGAGMVHPNVFRAVKYDPARVTGLAFGMGVERIAMLRYAIDDIHLFYENDIRFLSGLGGAR